MCTFEHGISALRCKEILSTIDFNNPIECLKSLISESKAKTEIAVKEWILARKREQELSKVVCIKLSMNSYYFLWPYYCIIVQFNCQFISHLCSQILSTP